MYARVTITLRIDSRVTRYMRAAPEEFIKTNRPYVMQFSVCRMLPLCGWRLDGEAFLVHVSRGGYRFKITTQKRPRNRSCKYYVLYYINAYRR